MGFFEKLFGKKGSDVAASIASTSPEPKQEFETAVIDMSKSAESLNKVLIDMSKSSKIDMSKHTARVALALDYSGSMGWLFSDGSVQKNDYEALAYCAKV